MFVDRVTVFVKGGDGGRGCASFRREAHVPRGGPDGGNGGPGGDVVLVGVSHQNTLLALRYRAELRAERGEHGGPSNCTGARGVDLLVAVPPGTEARDEASGRLPRRGPEGRMTDWSSREAGGAEGATGPFSRTSNRAPA